MVLLHEIIGPILAMLAVLLTILLFKKTIEFQAYRELDSNYMDILKLTIENPEFRDKNHINNYPYMKDGDKRKYDQFALMFWNFCETVYDRNKIDKTWYPLLRSERNLHQKWLEDKDNRLYFKDEFLRFIENKDFFAYEKRPPKMKFRNAAKVLFIL